MLRAKTLESRLSALERQSQKPIKPTELAEMLGVSKATVYRWLNEAFLRKSLKKGVHYNRLGNRWVILDANAFIREFGL